MILAEADAFRGFGLDRREALWAVRRLPDDKTLPLFAARDESDQPAEIIAPLPAMPLSEHVLADYHTIRLSLKGYPTEFLRERFDAEGFMHLPRHVGHAKMERGCTAPASCWCASCPAKAGVCSSP